MAEENWKPVQLAAKVIGHISQGMYRTPAGALKELISNAYDANATYAKIHTGFPTFSTFSCEDNGQGIAKNKFIRLMEGGIGDSEKQGPGTETIGKNGRPIVGRLGVGLLSLAQVCTRFSIRSYHASSKTAFEAEIKFPPYSRKEIDQALRETQSNPAKLISHGQYFCRDISYEEGRMGISITTSALREMFRKTMSSLDNFAYKKVFRSTASYPSFDKFLCSIVNPKQSSLYFSSQYDQLLFGLALASPIPYPETTSRNHGIDTVLTKIPPIAILQKELKQFDFRVEVDNIELRRPLVLPSNKDGIESKDCTISSPTKKTFKLKDGVHTETIEVDKYDISVKEKPDRFQFFYFSYSKRVNGYPLDFSGYIFLQTTRLFPKEYQGILIRLRNVAIGQYDVNVMTYPMAEGPRFSMLSSEVFVTAGLDDALKVDRDGFNTLDPQYIRLQAFVHSILHQLIFPGSWEEEKSRNKKLREVGEKESAKKFAKKLKKETKQKFTKIEIVSRAVDHSPSHSVVLDKKSGSVRIFESHPDTKAILGRKKYHGVAARVIAAFEVANQESSVQKRREVFYKLLEDIFNE